MEKGVRCIWAVETLGRMTGMVFKYGKNETKLVCNSRLVSAYDFCLTYSICSFRCDNNFNRRVK